MIPERFVLLDRLPLSENGKVDRSRLPPISDDFQSNGEEVETRTEMEKRVAELWCHILRLEKVPSTTTSSFFALGGNSLLLIKLFYSYQKLIEVETNSLSISELFRNAFVVSHAKLLENARRSDKCLRQSFNLTEGPASFAQSRLYLDERLRFADGMSIYHIPLVLQLVRSSISLSRLRRAICALIDKHKTLRTRLFFDERQSTLRQEILERSASFVEIEVTSAQTDDELRTILHTEQSERRLFDLNEGRVFRCVAIRRSPPVDEDRLTPGDLLVLNFHHVAIDGASIDICFEDLRTAYSHDRPLDPSLFDYIDYPLHEKEMQFDEDQQFWTKHLKDRTKNSLRLPFDRLPNEENALRSGRGSTVTFDLSEAIVERILMTMSRGETTLSQLGLSIFYAFLFKLTEETDLCVLTVSPNRQRMELEKIIGFFVNTLPHRLEIDPHATFSSLVSRVKELVLSTLNHSHLLYQKIIQGSELLAVQTFFDVETQHEDFIELDEETVLRPLVAMTTDPKDVAKFDLSCFFHYHLSERSITVAIDASTDLFDPTTVDSIAQRLHILIEQLFSSSPPESRVELSLLLPDELQMLRQLNNRNEIVLSEDLLSIHEQFVCRVEEHP